MARHGVLHRHSRDRIDRANARSHKAEMNQHQDQRLLRIDRQRTERENGKAQPDHRNALVVVEISQPAAGNQRPQI
jgi:hypothetical protein